jgi:hypothetical protein
LGQQLGKRWKIEQERETAWKLKFPAGLPMPDQLWIMVTGLCPLNSLAVDSKTSYVEVLIPMLRVLGDGH